MPSDVGLVTSLTQSLSFSIARGALTPIALPEATIVVLNGDGAEVAGPRRRVNFPVGLQDVGKLK